jgi:hypothetical protein
VYSKIHFVGGFCVSFVFLLYVAHSRQSARLFLQSSELAPQPQEMVSPLLGSGGGGHTLLRVRGSLYGVDVAA